MSTVKGDDKWPQKNCYCCFKEVDENPYLVSTTCCGCFHSSVFCCDVNTDDPPQCMDLGKCLKEQNGKPMGRELNSEEKKGSLAGDRP